MDLKLKENIKHGDKKFPMALYKNNHINCEPNGNLLYCHWHEEVEIVYLEKGNMTFYIDLKPVNINEGEIIFINKGELHSAAARNSTQCCFYALVFDLEMLSSSTFDNCEEKYIKPLLQNKYKFPLTLNNNPELTGKLVNEISEIIDFHLNKNVGYELFLKAAFYRIIAYLSLSNSFITAINNTTSAYKINRLKEILNYIDQNYNTKLEIETLAKEFHMNPQYFSRFFKAQVGKTPMEYINLVRINQAAKLLLSSDKKVSEIAYDVGFNNLSYFVRIFRYFNNCTPTEYKR